MRTRRVSLLLALAALSACSSSDINAPAGRGFALQNARASFASSLVSTKVKYKNAGVKPTKVQVGPASIEVRAIYGRDGTTLLEVTTGNFEDGTHTGAITRTLIKPPNNAKILTFNNLVNDGYWSTTLTGFQPGDVVDVQATVIPDGSHRPYVLNGLAPIALRPDVEVVSVTAPTEALRDAGVIISAALHERNGQVGARGDCALYVDGVRVDAAPGIWIDAGDMVSCMFLHSFAAAGRHDLTVNFENETPDDWDTANNSASASILINTTIASNSVRSEETQEVRDYARITTSVVSERYVTHDDQHWSEVVYNGADAAIWTSPLQLIDVNLSVDGAAVHTASLVPLGDVEFGPPTARVRCGFYSSSWESGTMCVTQDAAHPSTTFNYFLRTGSITNLSSTFTCVLLIFDCREEHSSSFFQYAYPSALGLTTGSTFGFGLRFHDGDGVKHIVDRSVAISGFSLDLSTPESCFADILTLKIVCETTIVHGRRAVANDFWTAP